MRLLRSSVASVLSLSLALSAWQPVLAESSERDARQALETGRKYDGTGKYRLLGKDDPAVKVDIGRTKAKIQPGAPVKFNSFSAAPAKPDIYAADMKKAGDERAADKPKGYDAVAMGGLVGGLLGGAAIGFMLGGPIGACAGALAGVLIGGLIGYAVASKKQEEDAAPAEG